MYIKGLVLGPVQANCYIVADGMGTGAVIDPGEYSARLESEIAKAGITELKYILCTHGHFDHVGGVSKLKERHPEAQVMVGAQDAPALSSSHLSLADYFGVDYVPCYADVTLNDGDEFSLGELTFKVISAPGHSLGGVVYYCESRRMMFTGDTLFRGSIGRTDLYGGSYSVLAETLKKFRNFPAETIIYSGHGEGTTIDFELKHNPYLR